MTLALARTLHSVLWGWGLLTVVGSARAHGIDHVAGHDPVRLQLAGGLLVLGTGLVVGSLYAERALEVGDRPIDIGVAVGAVLVVGALVTFWL